MFYGTLGTAARGPHTIATNVLEETVPAYSTVFKSGWIGEWLA